MSVLSVSLDRSEWKRLYPSHIYLQNNDDVGNNQTKSIGAISWTRQKKENDGKRERKIFTRESGSFLKSFEKREKRIFDCSLHTFSLWKLSKKNISHCEFPQECSHKQKQRIIKLFVCSFSFVSSEIHYESEWTNVNKKLDTTADCKLIRSSTLWLLVSSFTAFMIYFWVSCKVESFWTGDSFFSEAMMLHKVFVR